MLLSGTGGDEFVVSARKDLISSEMSSLDAVGEYVDVASFSQYQHSKRP